jgi:alanine racemase
MGREQSSAILIRDTKIASTDQAARPAPRLIVDLAAIQRNYRVLQDLSGTASVGAVVKANAYGLGAGRVVPALADAGCRTFYVAHTFEGEEARIALDGRDADIFVFNGFWPSELESLKRARLYPVINDLAQLQKLRTIAADLPCAVHFDTGMNRLGLGREEAEQLVQAPDLLTGLDVRQIMSHLACADEPDHSLNALQLQKFRSLRQAFPDIPASFANSAGALLGPDFHFDILRPGLALFGGAPSSGIASPFESTVRIEAPILQIRNLSPGDPIGYGALFTANQSMKTATVAAGYADGLLIACGNGGAGRIGNISTPILGRISMDLISVDISDAGDAIKAGDWVSFLGDDLESLAGKAATISYELLVRLGLRFHRVYRG